MQSTTMMILDVIFKNTIMLDNPFFPFERKVFHASLNIVSVMISAVFYHLVNTLQDQGVFSSWLALLALYKPVALCRLFLSWVQTVPDAAAAAMFACCPGDTLYWLANEVMQPTKRDCYFSVSECLLPSVLGRLWYTSQISQQLL